jgi:hypothetical protein
MGKGRQKGAKNLPGHYAGGARPGSGRKAKKPKEVNSTPSDDARGKRKQPDSELDTNTQRKKQKRCTYL